VGDPGIRERLAGCEPVDPMRRAFRGRTQGNEAEIVEGDLEEIGSCDAVLAAFTSPDESTAMEARNAHTLGTPVVAYRGGTPPHPWTVSVSVLVCAELEAAVDAVSR
jgi:nucleoside 2-deoxyribosyltransferase